MPGSGLGLSIVRQVVVERHSGTVTAGRCLSSGGSRFTDRLPGSPAPPERSAPFADPGCAANILTV
jgi:signal transduction histidine kinase